MSKKEAATEQINIPAIEVGRMIVPIVGRVPLILNRMRDEALAEIADKQRGKAKGPRAARDPEKEFLGALHMISDGVYGFPATGIQNCLAAAGYRCLGETMTELRAVMSIEADLVEIKGSAPRMRCDFVVLQGKTASVAYRPMFVDWSMDVPVAYLKNKISKAQVLNLFQYAGFAIGIGSWRKEKKGTFGLFDIRSAV